MYNITIIRGILTNLEKHVKLCVTKEDKQLHIKQRQLYDDKNNNDQMKEHVNVVQ